MKITVYELLGLIKDGKAPKKIKYKNKIYEYKTIDNGTGYVQLSELNGLEWFCNDIYVDDLDSLVSEVEIIEEKETKPSEEEIEAFKEQFNHVWNSITAVLGGILEALQEIDKEESIKSVKKEINNIEKLEIVNNGSPNSYALLNEYGTKCGLTKHSKIMCDKINELIDAINELRGKNEN